MTEQKSILLYLDTIPQWEMLTDAQAGILIKALLSYAQTGEQLRSADGMLMMAFSFIASQIDRDCEKYENKCERNKRIAQEREQKRKAEREQSETNVHERARTCTNVTYKDTDTDTDKDTDKERDTNTDTDTNAKADKPLRAHSSTRFQQPSVDEVRAYCEERRNGIDPQRFVDYYTANGWVQGKGKPIKDWRAAVRTWEQQNQAIRADPGSGKQEPGSFSLDAFDQLVNRFPEVMHA